MSYMNAAPEAMLLAAGPVGSVGYSAPAESAAPVGQA